MGYLKNQPHNSTENRFRLLLFALRLGGIPIYMKSVSLVRSLYNATLSICAYSVYLATVLDVIVGSEDLQQSMKTVRLIPNLFTVFWNEFNFRYRKISMDHLLRLTEGFTWEELPTIDPKSGYLTMAGWIPRIHKLMKNIYVLNVVSHFLQTVIRIISSRELVYSGWYWLDTYMSPTYELVILSQTVASVNMFAIFFGFPYFYAMMVCIACSQLEKLKSNLLNIKHNRISHEHESNAESDSDKESYRQLGECIRHHADIIKFLRAIEDTLNVPIFGILSLQLLALCIVAFSAITNWGDHTDVYQAFTVYLTSLSTVFIYCGFGTILTQQYESVGEAAWACGWVEAPLKFQRAITFIIANANKEFTLSAGKFISVSNKTMMSMVNESFSLFMFLLTMKDKSEMNTSP